MLRILISSLVSSANAFLATNQTSKWDMFRNFVSSTFSIFGRPLLRRFTNNDTVYECVNTLLSNPTAAQQYTEHRQQQNSHLNRFSRPNFRRRTHRPVIRIVNPTVHIHMHSP